MSNSLGISIQVFSGILHRCAFTIFEKAIDPFSKKPNSEFLIEMFQNTSKLNDKNIFLLDMFPLKSNELVRNNN